MDKDELLAVLKDFGLTEYEAKAYVALVALGPARAGQISVEANLPQ